MADQTTQDIKDRLNVVDVIAGYIPVKKAGGNFKALCPFHHEKTPSLHIAPAKQIWHCFGCGEGGDIFSFVQKMENVDFKEALKILADKAGVKLPEYRPRDPAAAAEEDRLYRINDFAARLYHQVLLKDRHAAAARQYLDKRGLKPETIKQWQIGFAPESFHFLEQALAKKNISKFDLVKAGVSSKNERGQIYDRFRGRITFPIFDISNRAVGFSARILKPDDKAAKYINSPETSIYHKGKVLFGLNFAKGEIRKLDEVIVVEGQMDCISAHQAGFKNVVASSGTALTQEQLAMLSRLTKNLKFCFDIDNAGENATVKAMDVQRIIQESQSANAKFKGNTDLLEQFSIKIVIIEGAKDVDELLSTNPSSLKKSISEAKPFYDFLFEVVFNKYQNKSLSIDEKKEATKMLLPRIAMLTNPVERDHYIQILASRLGTSERVLQDALRQQVRPKPATAAAASVPTQAVGPALLEKTVLGGMVTRPNFLSLVLREGAVDDFDYPAFRRLLQAVFEKKELSQELLSTTLAKEGVFMVESELAELDNNTEALERELVKSFYLLKLQAIRRKQRQLTATIARAEHESDKARVADLNKQFAQLTALRINFERQLS